MRRKILTLLFLAALVPPELLAADGGRPEDDLEVTLRTADSAVYQKHDLVLAVSFHNRGNYPVSLGEETFSIETLQVIDREGKSPEREAPGETPPAERVTVGARETHEWKVNLSKWYPRLTRKKGRITVRWSAGSLMADPLVVPIIQEHDPRKDRHAIILTEEGTMIWRMLPEYAPLHVKNFVDRARQGLYDESTIFRVVPGLKIEGGDPRGDGTGGWETLMMPEMSDLPPIAGMVGASRQETSMTSNTMFFLLLAPTALMQGKHTFFAVLEDGWDTVSSILARPRKGDNQTMGGLLLEPVRILSVTIK